MAHHDAAETYQTLHCRQIPLKSSSRRNRHGCGGGVCGKGPATTSLSSHWVSYRDHRSSGGRGGITGGACAEINCTLDALRQMVSEYSQAKTTVTYQKWWLPVQHCSPAQCAKILQKIEERNAVLPRLTFLSLSPPLPQHRLLLVVSLSRHRRRCCHRRC